MNLNTDMLSSRSPSTRRGGATFHGLWLLVALVVLLAGCAARQQRPAFQPFDSYSEELARNKANGVESVSAAEDANASADDKSQKDLDRVGSGVFINQDAARQTSPGPGPTGEVSFNFEGESLHAVVKAILGDFLQQNYVIAPGVQGNVTFSTAKPLRADQALSILEMLLRWNNVTMIWQDGRYTILPVQQALPGNLTPRIGALQNMRGYEVRAVPLQFISAVEMEKLLKPYAKPEALVNVDAARNMIVLAGSRAELENYLHTVSVFDVDWLAGMSVGVFNLTQTEATKTVTELEKLFGEGSNTPMAGMFRFLPLEGINAILVITPQPKYLTRIEEWIERFDLGGSQAGQRLYVYEVKNVKAMDLATTLADVFGTQAPVSRNPSGGSVAPGLESVQVRSVGADGSVTSPFQRNAPNAPRTQQTNAQRTPGQSLRGNQGRQDSPEFFIAPGEGGPVVDATGGIALGATEEIRVSAVEESNSILVLATSSQWESIRRVIERLDTIPLQVHIEAKILQVTLNDQLKYGVQWYFENAIGAEGGPGTAIADLAAAANGWESLGGSVVSGGNLGWAFITRNVAAIINTLDSVSSVHVLSAPSVVVLNNKSANINAGTQIPVTSSFINNGIGGSTGINQSYVQFRDTGITLSVTPRVNPGGLVFMEIDQQDSTPGAASDAVGGNVPVEQRKIKTEVAVQSGDTILLGGLIKQTDSKGSSGIPGLHRIPIIGGLFGGKNYQTQRQELLVMITPVVIRNGDDARRLTDEYSAQFRAIDPLRVGAGSAHTKEAAEPHHADPDDQLPTN